MPTCMSNRKLPPFLMFVDEGAEGSSDKPEPKPGDDLGFPKDTPTADMTPEQQAAYWRHQSKTQQKDADAYRKTGLTPEQIKKLKDDQEAARVAGLDDQQQAVDQARKDGQAAALTTAQEKYLRPAIEGQVIGLTRTPGESVEDATARVQGALKFADVTKFVNENGDLDADSIQTFAQSIAPKDGNDGNGGGDPLHQSYGREMLPPPGSAGSVTQYRKQTYEAHSTKK